MFKVQSPERQFSGEVDGLILGGPWGAPPAAPPGGFTELRFGAFLLLIGGDVKGHVLSLPTAYQGAPMGYRDRDIWRWRGAAWPDVFGIMPGVDLTGGSFAVTEYVDDLSFENDATPLPTGGVLWSITRASESTTIGYFHRDTQGNQTWFAKKQNLGGQGPRLLIPHKGVVFTRTTQTFTVADFWSLTSTVKPPNPA